ncbi:hypothetical protein EON67_07625, partial [archaeon]
MEKIRESIDAANQASIDMESVADEFMTLQAKGIITLVRARASRARARVASRARCAQLVTRTPPTARPRCDTLLQGGVVACMLDSTLHALTKHAWEKITDVGDQSNFVTETGNILKSVMPRLRAKLNEAAFRSFCDKVCCDWLGFTCARARMTARTSHPLPRFPVRMRSSCVAVCARLHIAPVQRHPALLQGVGGGCPAAAHGHASAQVHSVGCPQP